MMMRRVFSIGMISVLFFLTILQMGTGLAASEAKVTVALPHDLTTLNPFKARVGQDRNIYMALYQPLFIHDTATGDSAPCLAESYKFSENNKDILVKVRKGAKFHNGDPVTAHDVRFSWQQFIDEKNANAYSKLYRSIKDIEVVDDQTCIFHLGEVNVAWGWLFQNLFTGSKKYYEKVGDDEFTKRPIGSGPFHFVSRSINESITLEAVENHHSSPAHFKTLKYLVVPDEITRMAMLEKGEADLIFPVPPHQLKRLEQNKRVKIKTATVPSYYGLSFHSLNFPFLQDKNLRLAFNYAINRQEIVDKIFLGMAHPLHIFGSMAEISYDANIKYPYNPEKAKELIKSSSYAPGTPIMLTYHSLIANASQVAEAVQGYMEKVGVTIQLREMEVGTYLSLVRKKSKDLGPMTATAWFGSEDPDDRLLMGVRSNGVYTQVPVKKEIDQLIDEQHLTLDEKKRYGIINKIYQMLHEDPPFVPLFGAPMIYAMNDRIDYTWVNRVNRLYNLWEIKIVK
jgi:peptide/nickel transport system substrate-binding protein